VALKEKPENLDSQDPELSDYLSKRWIGEIPDSRILIDNYAPVEYYQRNILAPYLLKYWL
jgi:hypothetical protein